MSSHGSHTRTSNVVGGADDCCTAAAPEQSAPDFPADRRATLSRRVRLLVAATITYNVIEAAVAISAGTVASSTALIGFGLDSVIEVASAAAVAWQFAGRDSEARERTALTVIAVSFVALAIYVTVESVRSLTGAESAEHSTVGIMLAALSLVIMPFLSYAQRRTGREAWRGEPCCAIPPAALLARSAGPATRTRGTAMPAARTRPPGERPDGAPRHTGTAARQRSRRVWCWAQQARSRCCAACVPSCSGWPGEVDPMRGSRPQTCRSSSRSQARASERDPLRPAAARDLRTPAGPSTYGFVRTAAAIRGSSAATVRTCPPPNEAPHSAIRCASIPSRCGLRR